jgi:hypothetical protein
MVVLLRFYNSVSRGAMLITFVQRIVCAFHEHLPPLYQTGGQKCRDHANDHFLGKSGAHMEFNSTLDATGDGARLTKIPTGQSS